MSIRSVDDLALKDIVDFLRILGKEYDQNGSKKELQQMLKDLRKEQSSGSGQYSTGITGVKVIANAKSNDEKKRKKLLQFYEKVISCLKGFHQDDLLNLKERICLDKEVMDNLKDMELSLQKKEYYLLISGETSSGKSTVLNLILGDDVLPHNILKETSTICEVKYGDNKECVVHKKNQGSQKIPLLSKEECGMSFAEQLKPYVALKEEDDREMIQIERVEIYWPHPLLKEGIVIVDSPGLGESNQLDTLLMNYLPNAFAYIYVIDVTHAGGLPKSLKLKMKNMASKIHTLRCGAGQNMSRLTECTLFIGNKWDRIDEEEKPSVKRYVAKELSECWDIANIDKHLLLMSATDAIKVQRYGLITPKFKLLLESINQLILRSIDLRLYNHWQWLDFILSKIFKHADSFIISANKQQGRFRARTQTIKERSNKLQAKDKRERATMKFELQSQMKRLSMEMKEHIKSENFMTQFVTWERAEIELISHFYGNNSDITRENVENAIARRFSRLLNEWEKRNQIYADIHSKIVDDYLKRLNLLEEEFERIVCDGINIERQVAYLKNRSQPLPATVLMGSSAAIWSPNGLLDAQPLGEKGVRKIFAFRRRRTSRYELNMFKQINLLTYFQDQSEKFLNAKISIANSRVLDEARELVMNTKEVVDTYSKLIPLIINADRKIVDQLDNRIQEQEKLLVRYIPIRDKSEEMRKEIIPLGKELFPETLDQRDLKWSTQKYSHIGGGEFAEVYEGELTTVSKSTFTVAVKVFNKPFDDINARFYFNEEINIRHLKHKHVLELLGAIKKKLPRYDYKYVFVMPRCKRNLRKIIFEDNEANPTKSNNFNDATMMYFKWAKQIADGLKYIHDRGLVHRHLKLENIMIKENGDVAISDIGIVGQFKETERSIIYHAPEVLENLENLTRAADIYSFGIMLWEMWYGVVAFQELMPIVKEEFKPMIINGYRPKGIPGTVSPAKAQEIMSDCWLTDHQKRITAQDCLERLKDELRAFKHKRQSETPSRKIKSYKWESVSDLTKEETEIPSLRKATSLIGGNHFFGDHMTVNVYCSIPE